jgi:hypothetical protein
MTPHLRRWEVLALIATLFSVLAVAIRLLTGRMGRKFSRVAHANAAGGKKRR